MCSHAQPKCRIRLSIFLEKNKDCELILIDQALLKAWQISAHVVKSTTPQISTHLLGHNVKQAPLLNKPPSPPPPPHSPPSLLQIIGTQGKPFSTTTLFTTFQV